MIRKTRTWKVTTSAKESEEKVNLLNKVKKINVIQLTNLEKLTIYKGMAHPIKAAL